MPSPDRKRRSLAIALFLIFVLALVMGPGPGHYLINPAPDAPKEDLFWLGVPRVYLWALFWFGVQAATVATAYFTLWRRKRTGS